MKKSILVFLGLVLINFSASAFIQKAYQQGEELTFKLYYNSAMTGNVTAGKVVSKVKAVESNSNGQKQHHIVLKGETKGAFRWFFKVDDQYETYINTNNQLPSYFKKRIKEGSYEASRDVKFDQDSGKIESLNNKNQDLRHYKTELKVQDLLSSLYYIRSFDFENIQLNQRFEINLFMDDSVYQIQFEFIGYEVAKTSLGSIKCMKFAPHVLTGGVFADETPMIIYVSNDKNHLPVLAVSELMVGRATMELVSHKGLKHPFVTVVE